MDALKAERFLKALESHKGSIERKNIPMAIKVSERIGRIKERYPSIAGCGELTLCLMMSVKGCQSELVEESQSGTSFDPYWLLRYRDQSQ